MRFTTDTLASIVSYTKMAEPSPPQSPAAGTLAKKFEGNGVMFKGKIIGTEDLSIDRDEKICLDSMFKLKAVAKARGEHKQRIQMNLTISAVKIYDEITKTLIANHEIERISFVVIDPRDTRAFGYIYNTTDNRRQFWGIKTEKNAAATVLSLKELFDVAFEQYTNSTTTEGEQKPTEENVTPSETKPEVTNPPETTPVVQPPPQASLLDENRPVNPPETTRPDPVLNILDLDIPVPTVTPLSPPPPIPPPPKQDDLLADLFGDLTIPNTAINNSWGNVTAAPPVNVNPMPMPVYTDMFNMQPAAVPMAQPVTMPMFPATVAPIVQPTVTPMFTATVPTMMQPTVTQTVPTMMQPTVTPIVPAAIAPIAPQQATANSMNMLGTNPVSPVAPPSVINPFSGLDPLDLLGGSAGRTTKAAFVVNNPVPKTIQELQMQQNP